MFKYNFVRFVTLLATLYVCSYQSNSSAAKSAEFPGRDLYPHVPVIELNDLKERYDEVIIVDVRSAYEFETLRIKGAINIPLSAPTFVNQMRKLRSKDPRPIIVYCNGKTCMKSYKAALKCATNKIDNVHSFDAGIMEWARNNPAYAELLGKGPVDPKKLISKKDSQVKVWVIPTNEELVIAEDTLNVVYSGQ